MNLLAMFSLRLNFIFGAILIVYDWWQMMVHVPGS